MSLGVEPGSLFSSCTMKVHGLQRNISDIKMSPGRETVMKIPFVCGLYGFSLALVSPCHVQFEW